MEEHVIHEGSLLEEEHKEAILTVSASAPGK